MSNGNDDFFDPRLFPELFMDDENPENSLNPLENLMLAQMLSQESNTTDSTDPHASLFGSPQPANPFMGNLLSHLMASQGHGVPMFGMTPQMPISTDEQIALSQSEIPTTNDTSYSIPTDTLPCQEKTDATTEADVNDVEKKDIEVDNDKKETNTEEPETPVYVKKKKTRCNFIECKTKIGLLGIECKCGFKFCGIHRYAEAHHCTFDFKKHDRKILEKRNPQVVADKLDNRV